MRGIVEFVVFILSFMHRVRPNREAHRHRIHVSKLCLMNNSRYAERTTTLHLMPTSDIRAFDRIGIYVAPGVEVDEVQVRKSVAGACSDMFCPRSFTIYSHSSTNKDIWLIE